MACTSRRPGHPAKTHALNIDQQTYITYIISYASYLTYYFVAAMLYDLIWQHICMRTAETWPFFGSEPATPSASSIDRLALLAGLTYLAQIGRSLPLLHLMCTLDPGSARPGNIHAWHACACRYRPRGHLKRT